MVRMIIRLSIGTFMQEGCRRRWWWTIGHGDDGEDDEGGGWQWDTGIMDHGIRFSTISSIKPKSCKDHNVDGSNADEDDYDGRDGQFDKNTITLNQQNPSTHILWIESWLISICGVAITSSLTQKRGSAYQGWPKVEIIIPWLFIGRSRSCKKRWGSDLVTAVTRQFRQTPSPEHGNDCLTLISGSCFQKTYPLPTFSLCIQKNGQSPTKLRNTGYKNDPNKKFWEWLADGKRPKGCLRQFYSRDVTFTATGKHISKLFKVTSRGKRWRNRPF